MIDDILNAYKNITKDLTKNDDTIIGITLTTGRIDLIYKVGNNVLPLNDVRIIDEKMKSDFITFFNEKFILSTQNPDERELFGEDDDQNVIILRKFLNEAQEFICPCTGIETIISEHEVKIFLDDKQFDISAYNGMNNLMKKEGTIILNDINDRAYLLYTDGDDNNGSVSEDM